MSREAVRTALAVEVTGTEGTRNSRDAWRVYETWCLANDQSLFPDTAETEQQLLRFLHSNRGKHGWSWGTCSNYALGIAQNYRYGGHPDPRGTRIRAWLLAAKRQQDGKPAAPRTDALSDAQVIAAVASDPTAAATRVARLRGVVAAAEALGLDPTKYGTPVQRLPRDAFLIREQDIVITDASGERHLLDGRSQPDFFSALCEALKLAGKAPFPLLDTSDGARKRPTVVDTRSLRAAWDRAAPRGSLSVQTEAVWRRAFLASTPEDRVWWLKCVDEGFERRTQDRAYLLVGIETAHRHQTMRQLTLGHLEATDTGYLHEVTPEEHKGGRQSASQGGAMRTLVKPVNHIEDDSQGCPAHCPACALRDHLAFRQRRGATDTDPLWVTRRGTPLALGGANRRLRELVDRALADTDGRTQTIGTRSLRVTAATLARRSGMSPLQVAEEITNHAKVATAELYIRRVDPFSFDLTLPLK